MNSYFYRVYVPLQVMTLIALGFLLAGKVEVHWWVALVWWFLIGPVGMGTGYHRLFAHRSFETYRWSELAMAVLGTLAAYSPLLFFAAQHQYHHKTSDTDADPSSPRLGFWESFLWWRMRESVLVQIVTRQESIRRLMRDRKLIKISKHFAVINWVWWALTLAAGPEWFVSLVILPTLIEHLRINVISSLSHMNLPFNYRPYATKDDSQNNVVIGILSCGFGWHNTHHARPLKALCQERWWEIDIEGYVAWLLTKRT